MKKRLLSTLVALCIVLTLLPLSVASAADEDQGKNASKATMIPAVMPGSLTATIVSASEENQADTAASEDNQAEDDHVEDGSGSTKTPTVVSTVTSGDLAVTASVATARMTLQQLKDKFPDGRYWNGGNADSTTGSPCRCWHKISHVNGNANMPCECNSFNGGSQCYGFALKLGYDAYGSSPRTWTSKTESSYVDSLKPGDIVDNSSNPHHTVFVIGVTDTTITVGECNWGGPCLIKWGRPISKSEIKKYSTLKIYIAPSKLPITDTTTAVTPEITLSQSSVSMQVDGSATVTVGTKSPGAIYLKAYTSSSSICGGSWGSWNSAGTSKPLTLTGKAEGKATVTVCMYDSSTNAELTRKTISVQVIPAPTSNPQLSVDTLTTLNRTGTASLYPTVFKGYLRGTSQYIAYSDSKGANYLGHIFTSDELKVQSVYAYNGELWMSALCPWVGYSSDRLIYTKLDAVLDTSFAPYAAIASSAATVYTRSNAATKYGSLGSGDVVTVVGQSGQYSQVIYPLAVGGYKIGWCATSSLSRPGISSVTLSDVNILNFSYSLKLPYSLPANATSNMVVLDKNGSVLVRGSISKSSVNVNGLTPGATYYIYVESKLSNGTGTVTSPVKKVVLNLR